MSAVLPVAAALGSALAAATSSVLQHRSTGGRAPKGSGLHLKLMAHLVRRPLWLAGLVSAGAGFVLHAVALGAGSLAVVQPLLLTGLLFALPLSVLLERRRPSVTEWLWALVLVIGMGLFLLVGRPSPTAPSSDSDRLGVFTALAAVVAVIAWWLAHGIGRHHRPALLGLAGGITYGMAAGLTKFVVAQIARPLHMLSGWPFYALIIVGAIALVVSQAAYQAGPIAASLPPLTMADLVVSILAGGVVFHEHLGHSPLALTGEVLSGLVVFGATLRLARRSAPAPGLAHPSPAAVEPHDAHR